MRSYLLVLPVLLGVVLVSGCTTDIPFLSGLFGPQVAKDTADVVVIKSLTATPSTVFGNQQVRVAAYIENRGKKTVDKVQVELYDYCDGTFDWASTQCGDNEERDSTKCDGITLQPYEIREVRWTLTASDVKLETTCPADGMKVYVSYPHISKGLSTIALINSEEMQRQMAEGTYKQKTSFLSAGEGPIRGYINVEDTQPVPVSGNAGTDTTVISFQLKNEGQGFLAKRDGQEGSRPKVKILNFKLGEMSLKSESSTDNKANTDECRSDCSMLSTGKELCLIQKESPKIVCAVDIPAGVSKEVTKELTKTMEFEIEYRYEFRASVKVTVKPKAL